VCTAVEGDADPPPDGIDIALDEPPPAGICIAFGGPPPAGIDVAAGELPHAAISRTIAVAPPMKATTVRLRVINLVSGMA
jgi:hypothetical protein